MFQPRLIAVATPPPPQVKFFTLDATALALELGLGMRINTLMQSAFYRLSGVLPVDKVGSPRLV